METKTQTKTQALSSQVLSSISEWFLSINPIIRTDVFRSPYSSYNIGFLSLVEDATVSEGGIRSSLEFVKAEKLFGGGSFSDYFSKTVLSPLFGEGTATYTGREMLKVNIYKFKFSLAGSIPELAQKVADWETQGIEESDENSEDYLRLLTQIAINAGYAKAVTARKEEIPGGVGYCIEFDSGPKDYELRQLFETKVARQHGTFNCGYGVDKTSIIAKTRDPLYCLRQASKNGYRVGQPLPSDADFAKSLFEYEAGAPPQWRL